MEKKPINLFKLILALLFAFACPYSLFDVVQEADFCFDQNYEGRDIEDLCAKKGSNLDGVLVSATLFPPLSNSLLEFLPSFFSPNTFLVTTYPVLRC
jgi:hypothetical protein